MLHSPDSISTNTSDDILDGNPWAENGHEGQSQQEETTPTSTAGRAFESTDPGLLGRKRAQTIGHPLWNPEVFMEDGHRSAQRHGHGRGSSLEVFITRPTHRRSKASEEAMFKGFEPSMEIEEEQSDFQKPAEKEVIIHEVKPGDSLAGVALKYNVSMAALRTANKLWTSDTIHLRKQLYIPLDAVKSQATLPRSSTRSSQAAEFTVPVRDRTRRSASEWDAHGDVFPASTPNIRRVPVSELSFFPPSSNPIPRESTSFSSRPPSRSPPVAAVGRPSLANLLSGAKEEILSRMSFDSSRDTSETGDDQGMELDEVPWRKRSRARSNESDRAMTISPSMAPSQHLGALFDCSVTPPTKVIRTLQLQPSPSMVIPARPSVAEKAATVPHMIPKAP
ncbi:carbohydrate-binding module family 50 protein [Sphaerobolus stellatus SS14]|nr:carbohydrate-binding module family 50 protein [Sphaerobolus stellatus SS14]